MGSVASPSALRSAGRARLPAIDVVPEPDAPRPPPRLAQNWWLAVALALPVLSEWKLRVRPEDQTVAGRPDVFILLEIAAYGAVALWLALVFPVARGRLRAPLPLLLMWTYVGVLAVSAVWSVFPPLALVRAGQLVVVAVIAHLAARRATRAHFHRFAHAFLVACCVAVAIGVLLPRPRFYNETYRFNWLYLNPVLAGQWLGLAVVVAAAYLLGRSRPWPGPRWPAWAYGLVLAVVGGGLLATQTRGAIAAAVLGAFVAAWTLADRHRRVDVASAAVLGLGAVSLLLASQIAELVLRGGNDAAKVATLNSRTGLWAEAFGALEREPLFGYGLGASRGIFLEETGLGGGHNALVNVAVDIGVVGLALFLTLLGVLIARLVRLRERRGALDRALLLAGLSFFLLNGITTEELGGPTGIAPTWLLLSVAWLVVLERRAPRTTRVARTARTGGVVGAPGHAA